MGEKAEMTNQSADTKTKEYIRPMPANWWLKKKSYFLFMVRELTCLFVGGYAVFLLVLIYRARGTNSQEFAALFDGLNHPWAILLNLVVLGMALYHSITWFNLTPKAMVVWRGEERLSPMVIAGSNYVVWAIVSILIAWLAYRIG